MITIINRKGNNIFSLSNGFKVELKKDIPFVIDSLNYALLLKEYGCFFHSRIIKNDNAIGCYEVIKDKSKEEAEAGEQIEQEEVEEQAKQEEAELDEKEDLNTFSISKLKQIASNLNIKFDGKVKKEALINSIEMAQKI